VCERVPEIGEKLKPIIEAREICLTLRRKSFTYAFVIGAKTDMRVANGRSVVTFLSFLRNPYLGEIVDCAVGVKHKPLDIDGRVR
jgi:hypothetical protein